MRVYVGGPRLGPVRTVLWSGSTRGRRRARASWWSRRFRSPLYWLFGLWAAELLVRSAIVAGCLVAAIIIAVRSQTATVRTRNDGTTPVS